MVLAQEGHFVIAAADRRQRVLISGKMIARRQGQPRFTMAIDELRSPCDESAMDQADSASQRGHGLTIVLIAHRPRSVLACPGLGERVP